MKNGFKSLANKYEQEVSKAKNELDKILNLEIKPQTKEIKIDSDMIIKKPSCKVFKLIKNVSESKNLEEKTKPPENGLDK